MASRNVAAPREDRAPVARHAQPFIGGGPGPASAAPVSAAPTSASPMPPPSPGPPSMRPPSRPTHIVTSAGQLDATPSQASAGSHVTSSGTRQTTPDGSKVSGGQVDVEPVQTSAGSQPPAVARHSTPERNVGGHAAPMPLHVSGASQAPDTTASHAAPRAMKASAGHAAEEPVHASATSHVPAARRHGAPSVITTSRGQALEVPVHVSGTSHAPAAPRHTTPGESVLAFPALFPAVESRSAMAMELEALVTARAAKQQPAHKRVDARRTRIACAVGKGDWSLSIEIRGANHAYAVRHALNLINELFLALHASYPEYLVEHFGMSTE